MVNSGTNQSTRLQPDELWMTTEEAADALCVTTDYVVRISPNSIERIVRSMRGNDPVGSGYLWRRREVEYVAALRKGAHISLNAALRVFMSVRDQVLTLSDIEQS